MDKTQSKTLSYQDASYEDMISIFEDARSSMLPQAEKLVASIQGIIETRYRQHQIQYNEHEMRLGHVGTLSHVLISFFKRPASAKPNWDSDMMYRIRFLHYGLEANGEAKILRGLTDSQKIKARERNYHIPVDKNGLLKPVNVKKYLNVAEQQWYSEMIPSLALQYRAYRTLCENYKKLLSAERVALRSLLRDTGCSMESLTPASLDTLRSEVLGLE
ncbi:hypothetical protein ACPV5V_19580 [Vibrio campbellii]